MSEDNSTVSPGVPQRQQGNNNLRTLKSVYEAWNAAYRGIVPHGVRNPPRYSPETNLDLPDTFEEDDPSEDDSYPDGTPFTAVQDITPIPVVIAGSIAPEKPRDGSFCTFYTENVQSVTPQRIIVPQRYRTGVILFNQGPGIVYIAQDESVGRSGFPLMPNSATVGATANDPIYLRTTRDVWAIQQGAQTSNALLSIILQYDRSID